MKHRLRAAWRALGATRQRRIIVPQAGRPRVPAAGGAAAIGPQAAWADIHHAAKPINRIGTALFFNEPEPHGFWLAKNLFSLSLGLRRSRNPPYFNSPLWSHGR
jgi:hypothetical protein